MTTYYASSDIGGTFTDTAVLDSVGQLRRYKASTAPDDPVKGVLAAPKRARRRPADQRRKGAGESMPMAVGATRLCSPRARSGPASLSTGLRSSSLTMRR
jgi:predicted NBD/HSP70 family sugar kinase